MSNVLKTFGQSSVVGASCVASGSCASGHNGCCAQASTSFSQTGAGLRYTGPSEVALCDLEPNLLLRPELSLVGHVELEGAQASKLALVDGEESDASERSFILHGVSIDLALAPDRKGAGFIIYGEAIKDSLYDRGLVIDRWWSPQTVITFVREHAPIRARECYEARVLKDMFISLWLLEEDVGVCDMIRYVLLPMLVARQEVEFCKMAVLYNEFRVEQIAYDESWDSYHQHHLGYPEDEDTEDEDNEDNGNFYEGIYDW